MGGHWFGPQHDMHPDAPVDTLRSGTVVPANGKDAQEFRNYEDSKRQETVREFYRLNHTNQSFEFAHAKNEHYKKLAQREMTVWEVIELLDTIVDDSDPDTDVPNSFHDFQTAERIRAQWPEHDWFHLVGLLHDLGKILCVFGEPQWAVVGDTFPLGCQFSDKCVFPQFFEQNADKDHPVYSTEHGIYTPGCGLDAVTLSYGHDEYMYQVLVGNNIPIPDEGLYMIRYHSLYPWHTGGAYKWLENEKDAKMLPWVLEFNKFDLYSKSDELPDVAALKPYYQSLIDKYCPGKLKW
jgi:inositol oxygenase